MISSTKYILAASLVDDVFALKAVRRGVVLSSTIEDDTTTTGLATDMHSMSSYYSKTVEDVQNQNVWSQQIARGFANGSKQFAIENDIDMNGRDSNNLTPIMVAVLSHAPKDFVKWLISHGNLISFTF